MALLCFFHDCLCNLLCTGNILMNDQNDSILFVIHNNSVGNLECFIRTVVFRIQLLLFQIILYVLSALLQILCIKYTNRIGIILLFCKIKNTAIN